MRARAAAKRADRVTVAARRAAFLAEQIVRQAHADDNLNSWTNNSSDATPVVDEFCALGEGTITDPADDGAILFDTSDEWLGSGY